MAKKEKALKLKNGWLDFLTRLLDKPRHGKDARAKNRFLQLLVSRLKEKEEERKKLLEQYADKDKGKPVMEDIDILDEKTGETKKEQRFKISPENMQKFQKEYLEYLNEDFVIDVLPSNKVDIGTIKIMLENDTTDLNTEEGALYDAILTAFEEALE